MMTPAAPIFFIYYAIDLGFSCDGNSGWENVLEANVELTNQREKLLQSKYNNNPFAALSLNLPIGIKQMNLYQEIFYRLYKHFKKIDGDIPTFKCVVVLSFINFMNLFALVLSIDIISTKKLLKQLPEQHIIIPVILTYLLFILLNSLFVYRKDSFKNIIKGFEEKEADKILKLVDIG